MYLCFWYRSHLGEYPTFRELTLKNITMKKLLTLAVCLFSVTALCAQTQVIAHRGYHATKNSVRNSLSALVNAQDAGYYGSECDINETADGVLVVVHGPMHEKYRVQETDFATLRSQTLANGEILPTFEEYLVQAKKNTATKLIIEIKDHNTPSRETSVVKKVLKMVKQFKLVNDVEYIAFRQHVCDELVKWGPKGIKVAYLNGTLTPEYCKDLGYTGIDYSFKVMQANPQWIKQSHDLGLTVNIWTVNKPEDIKWCIDNKADYITSDNPAEVARQLGM